MDSIMFVLKEIHALQWSSWSVLFSWWFSISLECLTKAYCLGHWCAAVFLRTLASTLNQPVLPLVVVPLVISVQVRVQPQQELGWRPCMVLMNSWETSSLLWLVSCLQACSQLSSANSCADTKQRVVQVAPFTGGLSWTGLRIPWKGSVIKCPSPCLTESYAQRHFLEERRGWELRASCCFHPSPPFWKSHNFSLFLTEKFYRGSSIRRVLSWPFMGLLSSEVSRASGT